MIVRLFIAFILCCTFQRAEAGIPFMSQTVSWDEEVLLSDGQLLLVHRTETNGPDQWGRSGEGQLKEQTIYFSHNGKKIKWVNEDGWRLQNRPDILDFVNGVPVLVIPVHRWGQCEKYDFPQEGLVAFGYINDRWNRIPFSDLPEVLKVNLLRTTHDIKYSKAYKGERITPSYKQKREKGSNWGASEHGVSISEAIKSYKSKEESCARIHPPPDPKIDALKQENAEAEAHAQELVATVISSSNLPVKISPDEYRKVKGRWAGNAYLSESCRGIVYGIEPIRKYTDGGSWHLVGCTLILDNETRIPFQEQNLKKFQAPILLNSVTCNQRFIYTVKQQSKDKLIVHRFSNSGILIDALSVLLPDISKFFPEGKWPGIWNVLAKEDLVTITFGTYSYTATADRGGVLEQQVSYNIPLPER